VGAAFGREELAAPSAAYARGIAEGRWQADPAQQALLPTLDALRGELLAAQPSGFLDRLAARFGDAEPVRGLYLWGAVGRGKTLLSDLLYESLGELPRQRWHFHRFMGEVHARLRALPADTADTLSVVAKAMAQDLRVLLLDEFFVGDIGDAMILGRLLEQLVEVRGVTLLTTSNIPPAELYRDGLQRASFLPCIALLESHCRVRELQSLHDYRLRHLTRADTYLVPPGPAAEAALREHFQRLSGATPDDAGGGSISINGRDIAVKAEHPGVAWFEFSALCEGPRSAADYIEIARNYHTVLLSNVPRLGGADAEDAALRLVQLVDEFYDRHVNLLLSAAADPFSLYAGRRHEREFERTSSRLVEMRSAQYLALEHRP
jgi:cell division protein ZapE